MADDLEMRLKELAHPWDWTVRNEAVRRLEVSGDQSAVPALIEALREDDSPFVRASAARTLGKLGSADAAPALVEALQDEAFHVRQAAIWSLGEIGAAAEPALPALRALLESPERFPQAQLTVAQVTELAIARIDAAIEEAKAPPEATEAEAEAGVLSAEERKAKREAALAQKRAREAGEAVPSGEAAAPVEAAGEAVASVDPPAAEKPAGGVLSAEERQAKREAALARKRELEAERKKQQGG